MIAESARTTCISPPGPAFAPVVAIVTPYHNTGPIFFATVESVLRQSLQQWEWLIVDDGSDTDTNVLAALHDPRIRVIRKSRCGPSAARNAGVLASRAPLLFFLDSDDLIVPTALETLVWSLAARPGSAFVGSWAILFGREHLAWPRGFDTRHAFLYENMKATTAALVRRTVFEQVGGFDEARRNGLEDYEFWLRCAARGFWGHDVRDYLLLVRRKAAAEYPGYRWEFDRDPREFARFRRAMRARYPRLFREGLPRPAPAAPAAESPPLAAQPAAPEARRRVLLLADAPATAGEYLVGLARRISDGGELPCIVLLSGGAPPWIEQLRQQTPEVFDIAAFLGQAGRARFLHYLVHSRQIASALVVPGLQAQALLPALRDCVAEVTLADKSPAGEAGAEPVQPLAPWWLERGDRAIYAARRMAGQAARWLRAALRRKEAG